MGDRLAQWRRQALDQYIEAPQIGAALEQRIGIDGVDSPGTGEPGTEEEGAGLPPPPGPPPGESGGSGDEPEEPEETPEPDTKAAPYGPPTEAEFMAGLAAMEEVASAIREVLDLDQ